MIPLCVLWCAVMCTEAEDSHWRFWSKLYVSTYLVCAAPCGLSACKNRPAPFSGRMSKMATFYGCCDCLASSAPFTNCLTYLVTYLLTYLLTLYVTPRLREFPLAGCHTRRLNQALSVLSLSLEVSFDVCVVLLTRDSFRWWWRWVVA